MRSKLKLKGYQFTLIAIIILFSIIINFRGEFNSDKGSNQLDTFQISEINEEELKTSPISGKISVNDNSDWINLKNAGKCTGLGTSSNPYIVKDFVIDGGNSGSCIEIRNTDVYFKIKNCTLYNSGGIWGNGGIRFGELVSNGLVINNTIYDSYNGIFIEFGTNLNISKNNIFNNSGAGIHLFNSLNNEISENIILTNNQGIILSNSSSNTISGNEVSNNVNVGITIMDKSKDNKVLGNVFNKHGGVGIDIIFSSRNEIRSNTITNNTIGIILDENSMCNEYSNNIFDGNNDDIQDNQAVCIIENPFIVEITIALGIIFVSVIIATGLILKRRKSTIEVKRFKKHAKREAEENLLVEKRKKPVKLEFVETEKPKE